jgi:hypothetical protein
MLCRCRMRAGGSEGRGMRQRPITLREAADRLGLKDTQTNPKRDYGAQTILDTN